MTGHTSLLKADGLTAFRAGLPKEAVFIFVTLLVGGVLEVPFLEDPADGVRDGKNEAVFLEDRVFASYPFQLLHDFFHLHAGSEGQGDKTTDGLGFSGG